VGLLPTVDVGQSGWNGKAKVQMAPQRATVAAMSEEPPPQPGVIRPPEPPAETPLTSPAGPPVSADGKWWWDGTAWRPMAATVLKRRAWIQDWANESLVMAGLGLFCGFFAAFAPLFLLLGLIGGGIALGRSPHRSRAIAGIILNALGLALIFAGVVKNVSRY